MDYYRDNILDHYKNPRNFGKLDTPHIENSEGNPTCGDKFNFQIILDNPSSGREAKIKEIKFTGTGCAISTASASLLSEKVKNKTVSEVLLLKKDDVTGLLGLDLTLARLKCALLPLEVVHRGLNKFGLKRL